MKPKDKTAENSAGPSGQTEHSRYMPIQVRCSLWGRAAARCELAGCNHSVSWHPETKEDGNFAQAAHIVGFSEKGPRGEAELSAELAGNVSNLMLLCTPCHKLIDTEKENYPVTLLRRMKEEHEARVELVTGIGQDKKRHVLLYGANVGDHSSPLTFDRATDALFPDAYPAERSAISLGLVNSALQDADDAYWKSEARNLTALVEKRLRPRLATGEIERLAIFARAPQPLLMLLGYLLSDLPDAETYQLQREPRNWSWREPPVGFNYLVGEPKEIRGSPALVLALSATVTDERVHAVLDDATIWRVTVDNPHNDLLRSKQQLQQFREVVRPLLDRIKARHGESAVLHVFPAVPVAVAVDFGRVINKKVDLPLRIYDSSNARGGFIHALDLGVRRSDV